MNFELSEEQQMMRESFARFLDQESSTVRVRAAMPSGFDKQMWNGLAELGAFSVRVPEEAGGLGLGLLDAALLMEEAGRTLASGPVAETLVAARLLAMLGGQAELLERVTSGAAIVSLAFHDIAQQPRQWIAGGAVAEAVIARDGKNILLLSVPESARGGEDNLASTPVAELALKDFSRTVLSSNGEGHILFSQALEEWKLLIGAALAGLGRESLRLAAAYASERKQFGQFIGQFQAISHPLADLVCEVDGGKFLVWKAIRHIADGAPEAGAAVSIAAWWNSEAASRAVAQSLHTFGGYGLTTEYDIFLFNLRAKAWPLVFGDPQRLLQEAGRRLYGGERAVLVLPDAGDCPVDFDLGDDARSITT
ncbi:MAG: acyl-CoA dehydrogenase family protein, partial [Pseudomonadota bacterium]